MVAYVDVKHGDPEELVDDPQAVLKGGLDLTAAEGKVLENREDHFGARKLPRRVATIEKTFENRGIYYFKVYFILSGHRLYEVIAQAPNVNSLKSDEANTFFESFDITE